MRKGIDAYKIKLLALFFMILDHVHRYLLNPVTAPEWIPLITRFVSPIFLYLMIDGFYHTRNRKKFLIRLFLASLIMYLGNIAINLYFHNVNSSTGQYSLYSLLQPANIFFTLALLFAFVWCLENIKQHKNIPLSIFLAIVTATLSLISEGGIVLLPIAFIIWIFYGKKSLQCIGISVFCVILLAHALINFYTSYKGTTLYSYLCFNNEWALFLMIPLVLLYNGERGLNTAFSKYMFYTIYPIHIWIFYVIRLLSK